MGQHIIEMRELDYIYPDGHKALNNISIAIKPGESVGILGGNAAGKSTLLLLLVGVLTPTSGCMIIEDVLIGQNSLPVRRQHMGALLQSVDEHLFLPTVFDDVAFVVKQAQIPADEVEQRVSEALDLVEIPDLIDRSSYTLSVGEKRCVALAGALSIKPNVLILDEPTSGLDASARQKIIHILKTFKHTKIIAGFDQEMIGELCERAIVLKDGQIVADGKTKEIFLDSRLMKECGLHVLPSLKEKRTRADSKKGEERAK